ncbi:MAG: RnfABCDGE type electron transport complex subunit G [Clostridia bacterium]|jgi:electron transport complex protein RnfG|nr:RnfABCDGE type electron transport complex subunit G [Clostridia bacterium]MCI2001133.1 RnfABCDGE type electron transport complex subunit G [Clostridia bacterium]MCI2015823.1 RnfABCDGE type electron transport complex subunit G [Clostridia bacterium]
MNQISTPAIRLCVICVVCAFLLGICSEVTKEPIAAQTIKTQQEAMAAVLPDCTYEDIKDAKLSDNVTAVAKATDNSGNAAGFVVSCEVSSFGGPLDMMVGVDPNGTITGLRVLSHSDTPGLGARSTEPEFYGQFNGMSGTLAVDKDGGQVKAITSATITSRAVTSGANAALQWVSENGGAY